jgi:hypothetical protein
MAGTISSGSPRHPTGVLLTVPDADLAMREVGMLCGTPERLATSLHPARTPS